MIVPLLPLPLGCWFLYKAIKSFNRSPPPIATDSSTVLSRPLYAEPVYEVRGHPASAPWPRSQQRRMEQGISYKPSTFIRNATPRGG